MKKHKAEYIVQIQAETLCGEAETVESDLEPDFCCCFNDDTIDIDWVESQSDTLYGEFEIVNSDLEPDSSQCSYDTISDGDWGPDEHWGPVDNSSNCEENRINIAMPDYLYFVRGTEKLLECYS